MKYFRPLMPFSPWIVSGIISAFFPSLELLSVLVFALLSFAKLRKGFLLEWSSLIFFLAKSCNDQIWQNGWITDHLSILASFFFFAVSIISLWIHQPFTLQYAKLEVEKKFWISPIFVRVNQLLTLGFGIIFLSAALVHLYRYFHPNSFSGWMVWIPALVIKATFIKWFPAWYKKRALPIAWWKSF